MEISGDHTEININMDDVGQELTRGFFSSAAKSIHDFFAGFAKQRLSGDLSTRLVLGNSLASRKIKEYSSSSYISFSTLLGESVFSNLSQSVIDYFNLGSPLEKSDQSSFASLQDHLIHINKLSDRDVAKINSTYQEHEIEDDYRDLLVAESVAQVLAYLEKMKGDTLYLPCKKNGQYELVEYKVSLLSIGPDLPMMTLKTEDPLCPNWLIPRGTSPYIGVRKGALQSLMADISSSQGLDDGKINEHHEEIQAIIDDLKSINQPVYVAGHSLGGALAIGLRLEFHKDIDKMFAFGAPGVSEERCKQYEALQSKKLHMQTFNTIGDIVPKAGRFVLGSVHSLFTEEINDPLSHHIVPSLGKAHRIAKVDNEAENTSKFRSLTEGVRSLPSRIHWFAISSLSMMH